MSATTTSYRLEAAQRVGTGLAFIIFPLAFAFAFAVHPGLLNPHLLGPQELIERAHGNEMLHFGHALVTLSTGLLVVIALKFKAVLEQKGAGWPGFVGAALAIFGALMLVADKGALCLTMSALDTLPETQFAAFMPGLLAMFSKTGWLALLWGLLFLPIGFAVQSVALFRTGALSRSQAILLLIGVLLVGTPDGVEIVNLGASVLMGIALIPYGIQIIARPHHADVYHLPGQASLALPGDVGLAGAVGDPVSDPDPDSKIRRV